MTKRFIIVDGHKMVSGVLRDMLRSFPGIEVGHTYESGNALLPGLQKVEPDILLLDIQMPDVRGIRMLVEYVRFRSRIISLDFEKGYSEKNNPFCVSLFQDVTVN